MSKKCSALILDRCKIQLNYILLTVCESLSEQSFHCEQVPGPLYSIIKCLRYSWPVPFPYLPCKINCSWLVLRDLIYLPCIEFEPLCTTCKGTLLVTVTYIYGYQILQVLHDSNADILALHKLSQSISHFYVASVCCVVCTYQYRTIFP